MTDKLSEKISDANKFKEFMATVPNGDLSNFIDKITNVCNVKRTTIYNWRNGSCCIPESCKIEIENIAERDIWNARNNYSNNEKK